MTAPVTARLQTAREMANRSDRANPKPRKRNPWGRNSWAENRTAWRGVLETIAVVLAFLGFGLGVAERERAMARGGLYPDRVVESPGDNPDAACRGPTLLVDGFNVLHAGILGGRDRSEWWTSERRRELLARARHFDDPNAEIWVVFDGSRPAAAADEMSERVRTIFAPSADEWLVTRVRASPDPSQLVVVTADRKLAGRTRHHGARVASPNEFLDRCKPPEFS